jgi:hypothetical protein
MSRRARTRNQHIRRSGHVAVNSVAIAINGARKLSDEDVQGHISLITRMWREFAQGQATMQHWESLADTSNMAWTLASMGLGSGAEADRVISAANEVLADIHKRHAARGSWTLYADEIDALHWLVRLHGVQLTACSYSEFSRAMAMTIDRIGQARAGNAPRGAIVVVGQMSQPNAANNT